MIVPINIDIGEFVESININPDDVKQMQNNIISELATEFAMHWNKQASVLTSSKVRYKAGIRS